MAVRTLLTITSAMEEHLSRAHQLLASGQLDEARIYLEELLRQDPENPDLLYNLGLCYVDLGQLEKGFQSEKCMRLEILYQTS